MIVEIKDELNNIDINLAHITTVIEEKTTAYPNFNIFLTIGFTSGANANLKGWGMDKWRSFRNSLNK